MIDRTLKHKQTGEVHKIVGTDGDGKWIVQAVETFTTPTAYTVDGIRATFRDVKDATAPERASEQSGWDRLGAFIDRAVQRQASPARNAYLTPEQALNPAVERIARETAERITADPEGQLADYRIGLLPVSPQVADAIEEIAAEAADAEPKPRTRRARVPPVQARQELGHRS